MSTVWCKFQCACSVWICTKSRPRRIIFFCTWRGGEKEVPVPWCDVAYSNAFCNFSRGFLTMQWAFKYQVSHPTKCQWWSSAWFVFKSVVRISCISKFINSLTIHQVKTKKITIVKEVCLDTPMKHWVIFHTLTHHGQSFHFWLDFIHVKSGHRKIFVQLAAAIDVGFLQTNKQGNCKSFDIVN